MFRSARTVDRRPPYFFAGMDATVKQFLSVLMFCGLLCLGNSAVGQEPKGAARDPRVGTRILIVRHGAPIRTPDATVWTSYLGEVFTVALTNGEWLWISEKGGWLWEKETVPFDSAIQELSGRLTRVATSENYHLRGVAYLAHQQYEKAIADFSESLRKAPKNSGALNNRGKAYYLQANYAAAINDFTQALALESGSVLYLNNRALAYIETEQYKAALNDLNAALKIVPEFAEALNNRGIVHQKLNLVDQAIADFTAALKVDAKYVDALGNRAFAYRRKQQYANAISDLEQAIRISPLTYEATNDLAWLLATCPDDTIRQPARALELAKAACGMTEYRQWNTLDTLAAALADQGQFDEAGKWISTAIETAPEGEKARLMGHRELIAAGKPVRE
ncbi:MAG: hypothetical protein RLZZ232_722 [Planctomycetota bacterium]